MVLAASTTTTAIATTTISEKAQMMELASRIGQAAEAIRDRWPGTPHGIILGTGLGLLPGRLSRKQS